MTELPKIELPKLRKLLYRVEEAGNLLSFGDDTIRRLVDEGKLQAHCHNGQRAKPLMITARSIVRFISVYAMPYEGSDESDSQRPRRRGVIHKGLPRG